jgi:hypothetical protein
MVMRSITLWNLVVRVRPAEGRTGEQW